MALGYLMLVAATALFVAFTIVIHDIEQQGANLSGVWLVMVTLPFSMLVVLLVDTNLWLGLLGLLCAAFLNAGLVYFLGAAIERSRGQPPRAR